MVKVTIPFKWHGGKHYLAQKILELMPTHLHYVEPFFGSGAVYFAKPDHLIENHSEVINDIYSELMNFYTVLRDRELSQQLRYMLELTPFSEQEWLKSKEFAPFSLVENAARFFIRYRQSRQGLGKCFATLSKNRIRRGMNEQVSAWLSAVDGLYDAHLRLQRTVILCDDALNVIRKEDSPNTFFYLDPPYLEVTRIAPQSYEHEFSIQQHKELIKLLGVIQGKFILSGYANELYAIPERICKWRRLDVELPNNASADEVKERKIESLWMNY